MGLTFDVLRQANINRLPTFKNSKGELTHDATGANWTPAQWLQALTGELGEYANIRKKFERGDIDENAFKDLAGKELADVQTYLDILAFRLDIDLGLVTMSKFNQKSREVGSPILIVRNGTSVINETRFNQWAGDVLFVDRNNANRELEQLADKRAMRNYELRCRIMELEAEMKQLADRNKTMSHELATCLSGIRSHEEVTKELSIENSKLRRDNATLNGRCTFSYMARKERECSHMREEIEGLKKRNASLNETIDDLAAKIVDKDRQIETKNERIRSLNSRYDEKSKDLVSSRINNHRLSVEKENIIIKNKDLQDHIFVKDMELSQLKEKLNAISKLSDQEPVIEVKVGMDQIKVHRGSRGGCTNYNMTGGIV